jgi:hypothetical protein
MRDLLFSTKGLRVIMYASLAYEGLLAKFCNIFAICRTSKLDIMLLLLPANCLPESEFDVGVSPVHPPPTYKPEE